MGALIRRLTDWPRLDVGYIRNSIHGNFTAYVIWIVLVECGSAAFGEKLPARGFIMNRLETVFGARGLGIVVAIAGPGAFFGALHAIQGPTGVLVTADAGIVLDSVYDFSGRNFWAPILAHGLMYTMALTAMYLGLNLPGYIS